jgi:HK97 family phage major capsid protein
MYTLEELRRMRDETRAAVKAAVDGATEVRDAGEDITDEHDAILDELVRNAEYVAELCADAEARDARISKVLEQPGLNEQAGFHVNRGGFDGDDIQSRVADRTASNDEQRSFVLERAEQGVKHGWVQPAQAEGVESLIGRGRTPSYDPQKVLERAALTETEVYRDAFMKNLRGAPLSDREAQIVSRAQSIGTDSEGGFGVPVLIDPTILVTTGTGVLGLLDAATVVPITNDEWKGVSAPVAAWSGDAEAAEVSDDAVTMAQPTITTEKPQVFVPYSLEVGMDYPGFASEMGRVISAGYRDYLASELADGTAGLVGVETGATTTVDVTTDNTFAIGDVRKVYAALPELFRENASWFYNVGVENSIRGFATSDGGNFTVDLTAGGIGTLLGKRTILSDYANGPSATTALTDGAMILVIGDMSYFVVAQRVGMSVEVVPHLFGANRRPTGQRGLYAYARAGSGVTVANAFRKLKNITT